MDAALRDYGVVFADGTIDANATEVLRATRTRSAKTTFGFGPDRERWEAVFTDAAMTELNDRLYALPKAVRQDVRRAVFEAVVPGITESAGRPITDLLIEPAAAARRLREQLELDGIATCSTRIAGSASMSAARSLISCWPTGTPANWSAIRSRACPRTLRCR